MHSTEFVSGFTTLQRELKFKFQLDADLNLIRLWFSETATELYVHNYADHSQSLLLAMRNSEYDFCIRVALPIQAVRMISEVVQSQAVMGHRKSKSEMLNEYFLTYGTFIIR